MRVVGGRAAGRPAFGTEIGDHPDEFVVPADVDHLIVPVLCHRIAYTAMFHADARRTGWDAAIDGFREAVLERAPRPEMPDSEIGAEPV